MKKYTKAEAFANIKKLLFGEEVKMSEAKLADGTIIQWEGDLVEGAAINVIAEDGNMLPAPDGTHELEDGVKVTTVGGLITSIEQKEEVEVEIETEMESEFQALFAKHLESFNELTAKFAALESKLGEYDAKFSAINETIANTETSVNDKFSKVVELVESISDEPAAKPEPAKNVLFKKVSDKAKTTLELFHELDKQTRKV